MGISITEHLQQQLDEIRAKGLYKAERVITTPQDAHIRVGDGQSVLNMCANNYLGLAEHPAVIQAAHEGLDRWGYGLSSVRFICGTQAVHKQLEAKISEFLGTEDTILYTSCFDANGGLFETLLTADDAIISDELNHASIIDGVRLCKAQRFRYQNNNMADLEERLRETSHARYRMIATDGVFSMDGYIANLPGICELADKYHALVMVDDSHAVGFMGKRGRGTHEHHGVMDRIDVITGTLGKALGGASGGYTSGRREFIDILRQRSRPYLFSNSVAPPIVAGVDQGDRSAVGVDRTARQAGTQHTLLPPGDHQGRIRCAAGRASDRADHALRRGAGQPDGRCAAQERRLRHRLLLPGRPRRACADPHADFRRPLARRSGLRPGTNSPRCRRELGTRSQVFRG